jgi:hypothetical protein
MKDEQVKDVRANAQLEDKGRAVALVLVFVDSLWAIRV